MTSSIVWGIFANFGMFNVVNAVKMNGISFTCNICTAELFCFVIIWQLELFVTQSKRNRSADSIIPCGTVQ